MDQRSSISSVNPVKVLIAANHKIVSESLTFLLESHRDIRVEGTCGFDDDLPNCVKSTDVDVAVVYLELGDAVSRVGQIREAIPAVRVVVIVNGDDFDSQTEALKLGAVGIVRSEQSSKLLVEAIRQTYKGETWLNQTLLTKIINGTDKKAANDSRISNVETLTRREEEIIKLLGKGLKSKVIAKTLFISEATVRHHLSSIYGKMGVDDRLNLVILAYQKGLIQFSELSIGE
jgi:DNA-binding NarL/FixJ family response regulator